MQLLKNKQNHEYNLNLHRRELSRSRKVTVTLCSELGDNIWNTGSRAARPIFRGTLTKECVQRRATRMVRGLKTMSYKECLRDLATLSGENS